ncbi:hypothetical protein HF329_00840 [Chitinophaga oryzae]|uniref:Uncharacterized protein n=1 Tax=Chitinophaga oryzae TaxID=2725414 RepID=A0AAE6ZCZ3_9BACT|nr:hypothetical protein [Chitinophaga oryzae]QJB29930.1 hypothetical protein HF329_00840 [Chitinophaga oryzae]
MSESVVDMAFHGGKPAIVSFHPLDVIDQYLVFRHTHPGHQVYEIGHEFSIVGRSTDLMDAYDCLLKSPKNEDVGRRDILDYTIIATYKHRPLELDFDGDPIDSTGLRVGGLYYEYNTDTRSRSWEFSEAYNPCKPIVLYDPDDFYSRRRGFRDIDPIYLHRENDRAMNEKVFEYHKNDLRSRGIGDALDDALKIMLEKGEKQGTLYHTQKFGEDLCVSSFHYNKSNRADSDLVFLNQIELLVKPKIGEIQRQTFEIDKDSARVTVKNLYNAMQGRSFLANKDTNEWAYQDFKQTDKHGNHPLVTVKGYDIQTVTGRYDIDQLKNPEEAQILHASLERGNRQMVSVNEKRFFISALPQHDTLRVYKENLQQTTVEALKEAAQEKQKNDQAPDQSIAKDDKALKNNRGQSIS